MGYWICPKCGVKYCMQQGDKTADIVKAHVCRPKDGSTLEWWLR